MEDQYDALFCFQDVISYSGSGDEEVMQYFHVDPDSGTVTIKKMMYPGTRTNYEVREIH